MTGQRVELGEFVEFRQSERVHVVLDERQRAGHVVDGARHLADVARAGDGKRFGVQLAATDAFRLQAQRGQRAGERTQDHESEEERADADADQQQERVLVATPSLEGPGVDCCDRLLASSCRELVDVAGVLDLTEQLIGRGLARRRTEVVVRGAQLLDRRRVDDQGVRQRVLVANRPGHHLDRTHLVSRPSVP